MILMRDFYSSSIAVKKELSDVLIPHHSENLSIPPRRSESEERGT
jgi:hypothetical protein